MPHGIVGRGADLLLEPQPGRVSVQSRPRPVPPQGVGLGEDEGPHSPVVVERARAEPEQQRLLRVVQHPHEVDVVRQEGRDCGGVDLFRGRPEHRPRPGEVALSQRHHEPPFEQIHVRGGQGERPIVRLPGLGVVAGEEEQPPQLGRSDS